MTAASAYPSEPAAGRPSEPSMEDILASIRRIIADDQNGANASPTASHEARRPLTADDGAAERAVVRARTPYDDVLDLARLVPSAGRSGAEQPKVASSAGGSDGTSLVRSEEREEEWPAATGLRARMSAPVQQTEVRDEEDDVFEQAISPVNDDADDDLLSPPLGDSVLSAFETLAATVVLQNTPMLERVMRDLLRPMLKTWLDDNLPGLVEKLVRNEIERVARGSRG